MSGGIGGIGVSRTGAILGAYPAYYGGQQQSNDNANRAYLAGLMGNVFLPTLAPPLTPLDLWKRDLREGIRATAEQEERDAARKTRIAGYALGAVWLYGMFELAIAYFLP
jgi:hypothetical protein